MSEQAKRDQNYVTSMLFVGTDGGTYNVHGDELTGRMHVDVAGGSGTVTSVSVVSANGFAGTVATATTTPAITLTTTVTGILYGNGTSVVAATGGQLPVMTATVGGAVPTPPNNTTTFLRGDGTFAAPAGGGTVTNTGGNLTANAVVLGAGVTDVKVVVGITTDGTSILNLGVNATTIGKVKMFGNTSGDVTILPNAVAGTATTQTFPATTGVLVNRVTTGSGVSASNTDGALAFTLGAITPTTVNGNTFTTGTYTLTGTAAKTLNFTNSLTLSGTDATTMTFPTTSKTIAANDGSNWTIASQAIGDILTATSTTAYGRVAAVAVGQVLTSAGTGTAPAYSASPQVTTIELGNATDTTLARVAAGILSIEGEVMNGYATTATAAGTTTLAITDKRTQYFTGSSTQTVKLPTTSVILGQSYVIKNLSSGSVTVQSSGANTILVLGAGMSATFVALAATPTTAANWDFTQVSALGMNVATTASANAATADIAYVTNTITNNSAATITVTMPTAGAVDGEIRVVRVLDFSAAAQTLTWVNTENSTATAPILTNGSTTLPISACFQYNAATSKWRCTASA